MNLIQRMHSGLGRLAVAAGLALAATFGSLALAAEPASADILPVYTQSQGDKDGDGKEDFVHVLIIGDQWWAVWDFSEVGEEWDHLGPLYGNPNPEEGSGPKDAEAMLSLAKQSGGVPVYEQDFFETPAGRKVGGGGGGPDAVWNPSEDGSDGQRNPRTGIDEVEQIDTSKVGGPSKEVEHDAGSPGSQVKQGAGSGGGGKIVTGGDQDNDDVDQAPGAPDDDWWEAEPVAPRVNPPTVKKSAGSSQTGKTGAARTAG